MRFQRLNGGANSHGPGEIDSDTGSKGMIRASCRRVVPLKYASVQSGSTGTVVADGGHEGSVAGRPDLFDVVTGAG
jgi:hypothetical protein